MKQYHINTVQTAINISDEAERNGEATLDLNGYAFYLNDEADLDTLELVMLHERSAEKALDLFDRLRDVLEEPDEPEPEMTDGGMTDNYKDARALAEVEAAQRVINHDIGENFGTDVCQDEKGLLGFCYNPRCFASRAKRLADGDAA